MSNIRDKMQYSRANTDQESSENLLSDEELHVRQPEKKIKPWRQALMLLPYILGTLFACFFTGLAGFYWNHDLDSVCASHTSEYCEFSFLCLEKLADKSSPCGGNAYLS